MNTDSKILECESRKVLNQARSVYGTA